MIVLSLFSLFSQQALTSASNFELYIPLSKEQKKILYDAIGNSQNNEVLDLLYQIDYKCDLVFSGRVGGGPDPDKTEINNYIDEQQSISQDQKTFLKNLANSAPGKYVKSITDDMVKLFQGGDQPIPEPTKQIELPRETPEPQPDIEQEASMAHHVPIFLYP